MKRKPEATVKMKLYRGLGLPLLAGAEREHADYFFDEATWQRIKEASEMEGVETRALICDLVEWALRARASGQYRVGDQGAIPEAIEATERPN